MTKARLSVVEVNGGGWFLVLNEITGRAVARSDSREAAERFCEQYSTPVHDEQCQHKPGSDGSEYMDHCIYCGKSIDDSEQKEGS